MGATNDVRRQLEKCGIRALKAKGQNFLIDDNISRKIVALSGIDKTCGVLEVGAGIGALTVVLARSAGMVVAVELDGSLLPLLEENIKFADNVKVVHGNILRLNIKKLVSSEISLHTRHVCANLPYNITTHALTSLIDAGVFETITVMVQKEVAQRICAGPGTHNYGAFSVYANYHTKPKILFDVPSDCFFPKPAVTSSVITMKTNVAPLLEPVHEKAFFAVVRASFSQRRKTLLNALHSAFGSNMSKEEIAAIITKCGFEDRVRGETLGIDEFAGLADYFKGNNIGKKI